MNAKYFAGLFGATILLFLLSIAALSLFVMHLQFRQSVGHDKPSFDKFVTRVESGSFQPETMTRFTNSWFLAQKQAHQVIEREEIISDRLAGQVLVLGVLGLLAALFQTWMIFSLRSHLRNS